MKYNLETFNNFLNNIDLQKYKNEYSKIKIVEMDLPRDIQALNSIYKFYWDKEDNTLNPPLSFDDFYKAYYNNCEEKIKLFWDKSGFGKECDCFQKGLKARIYRTWASLITQIHAGYVAESVFGENSVEMSTELDHKGIDILVHYKNKDIKIQIKKDSKRPEIARMHSNTESVNSDIYNIWYIVPTPKDYNNPYYSAKSKHGELRNSVKPFIKYNSEGTLDRMENGFVIFTKKEFELIKNDLDNK